MYRPVLDVDIEGVLVTEFGGERFESIGGLVEADFVFG
jgi:hypothetical protein